jgi:hypothetical protein
MLSPTRAAFVLRRDLADMLGKAPEIRFAEIHIERKGNSVTRSASAIILGTLVLATVAVLAAARATETADSPDWNAVAAVDTVEVLTKNPDGSLRETTIWLVVLDGEGYIRTGNTRWWSNIEQNQDVALQIEGKGYLLHVVFVEDPKLRQRVVDAFRAKYGWIDRAMDALRSGVPHIMRLRPRSQ